MTIDAWMHNDGRLGSWEARGFWPDDDPKPPMEPVRLARPDETVADCPDEYRWTRARSEAYHREFAKGWYRSCLRNQERESEQAAELSLKRNREILARLNAKRNLDLLIQWHRQILAERRRLAAIRNLSFFDLNFEPSTNNDTNGNRPESVPLGPAEASQWSPPE